MQTNYTFTSEPVNRTACQSRNPKSDPSQAYLEGHPSQRRGIPVSSRHSDNTGTNAHFNHKTSNKTLESQTPTIENSFKTHRLQVLGSCPARLRLVVISVSPKASTQISSETLSLSPSSEQTERALGSVFAKMKTIFNRQRQRLKLKLESILMKYTPDIRKLEGIIMKRAYGLIAKTIIALD
ncbi:hypothetical protein YC2023_015956 [Brassica napus]